MNSTTVCLALWLGVVRLYVPATEKPAVVDWIELRGKGSGGKPQRWDFAAPNSQ